tara:strand:- start:1074 stop:1397 length:324 start_codon:yes stop_codon:yes gene_type:complete
MKKNKKVDKTLKGRAENKHYKKYIIQKEKLKAKYPSSLFERGDQGRCMIRTNPEEQLLWNSYIKKLLDIIFKNNGHFQRFLWDVLPEQEKIKRDYLTKPSKSPYYNY